MENQEEIKELNEDEEKRERRYKVNKVAGYAGIGCAIGYIISTIILAEPLWILWLWGAEDPLDITMLLILFLSPILGGVAGGALSKKWWGTVIGSIVAYTVGYVVIMFLSIVYLHTFLDF